MPHPVPTCALADYPELIKTTLGYPEGTILLCGMALDYEDKEATINSYWTPCEKPETFTKFHK